MSKLVVTNIETQNIKFDSDTTAFIVASDGTTSGVGAPMTRLASGSSTSTVSELEISTNYAGFNNFKLTMNVNGDNTSSTTGRMLWKRDGQSSYDSSTDYAYQSALIDSGSGNNDNQNGSGTYLKWFGLPNQASDKGFTFDMFLNGIGSSTRGSSYTCLTTLTNLDGSYGSWIIGGGYDNATMSRSKVISLKLYFGTGNFAEHHYELYGIR